METWRDIAGFEGLYQVSDTGQARSLDREVTVTRADGSEFLRKLKGKKLKPRACTNGYVRFQLGAGFEVLAHRAVALAFLKGDIALQVNHKNGKRDDNRLENLEWLTCSANQRHSYRELNRKEHAKTTPVELRKGNKVAIFQSEIAAAKAIGRAVGSVHSALKKGHRCNGWEVNYGAC